MRFRDVSEALVSAHVPQDRAGRQESSIEPVDTLDKVGRKIDPD